MLLTLWLSPGEWSQLVKSDHENDEAYQLAVQYKSASLPPSKGTFDDGIAGCDSRLTGSKSITFPWGTEAFG